MSDALIDCFSSDDTFAHLLSQRFNNQDQQLFAQSFKTYLEHGTDDTKFVICLDDIWKWLGFARVDPCKRLLTKHFIENKDYTVRVHQVVEQKKILKLEEQKDKRGGHNRQTVMMTVKTFKKLCMKAATTRSGEIHDYYIKLEDTYLEYIKLKYASEIEQKMRNTKEIENLKCELSNADEKLEYERNDVLVNTYKNDKLVYVMKLQSFEDGTFIIKIGKTTNLRDRVEKLRAEFRCRATVMEVYVCDSPEQFERFLHTYPDIRKYKYNELINGFNTSTECYLVSKKKYKQITQIMNNHVHKYNNNLELLRLRVAEKQIETISTLLSKIPDGSSCQDIEKIIDKLFHRDLSEEVEQLEVEVHNTEEPEINVAQTTQSKVQGPYVQMYDKDDLTKLVKVYESITEATRDIKTLSFTQLKLAASTRTVYQGHRWFLLDRSKAPERVYDIGETVTKQERRTGYVCMLDKDQTSVEQVFRLQKEAALHVDQHVSALSTAIKYNRPLSGKYWIMWDALSEDTQQAYLAIHSLPEAHKNVRGLKVHQIDPKTGHVLKEYHSLADVVKEHNTSAKTIKAASKKDTVHAKYKWKII
jgi:hypothetical protein